MNVGTIFVCLLIGAIIGFEAGKYMVSRRIGNMMTEFAEKLKKEAEEARQKREEAKNKIEQLTNDILMDLEKMKERQANNKEQIKEENSKWAKEEPLSK